MVSTSSLPHLLTKTQTDTECLYLCTTQGQGENKGTPPCTQQLSLQQRHCHSQPCWDLMVLWEQPQPIPYLLSFLIQSLIKRGTEIPLVFLHLYSCPSLFPFFVYAFHFTGLFSYLEQFSSLSSPLTVATPTANMGHWIL